MSIYVGNKKISKITIGGGGAIVKKAFKGSTLVLGKEIFEYTFTSSGNITLPQTLTSLYVVVVGAGGGGHILKMLGGLGQEGHLVDVLLGSILQMK